LNETVAIIGAGPLGRWLALAAARTGFRVLLEDVMPANLYHAQEYIHRQLGPSGQELAGQDLSPRIDRPGSAGVLTSEVCFSENSSVTFVSTIEDAVREADLAIDCVPDELESKLEIFWLLDRMAPPRTVLATPTTRLSIADLASCTYRPEKCIAIAQEASSLADAASTRILLRTTTRTSPATVALLDHFWRRLGFLPTFAPDEAEQLPN